MSELRNDLGRNGHNSQALSASCPVMENLPLQALAEVAEYFQALSEPTRLQVLNILRHGERNVGELAQACGCTSANISRHLSLLTQRGLLARESRGNAVYYRIAEDTVYALCDLVCDNIARQVQRQSNDRRAFARPLPSQGRDRRRAG